MSVLNYLVMAEKRQKSINMYHPESSEVARFRDVIIPDLMSKLTPEDIVERARVAAVKTPEQIKAERTAMLKEMEANRDKPSI